LGYFCTYIGGEVRITHARVDGAQVTAAEDRAAYERARAEQQAHGDYLDAQQRVASLEVQLDAQRDAADRVASLEVQLDATRRLNEEEKAMALSLAERACAGRVGLAVLGASEGTTLGVISEGTTLGACDGATLGARGRASALGGGRRYMRVCVWCDAAQGRLGAG
jgi:hypothetical protein